MASALPRKPFSMIREFHLADWFTLGNAVCGTAAMFSTVTYVQTGMVGKELDSLADVISFGVTPALIAYGFGMQGLYDRVMLAYFVACGVSRLARYNVTVEEMSLGTGKVTHFEGTPIPTSFLVVLLLTFAAWRGALGEQMWFGALSIEGHIFHPLTLLFAVSGSLMISRIPIPKL